MLNVWGVEVQTNQALEECGEFITVTNHKRRNRVGMAEWMEEVVDVYIVMQQMRLLDADLFDEIYDEKMKKLIKRFEKYLDK